MEHAVKIACIKIQRRIFLISGVEINLICPVYPRIVGIWQRKSGNWQKLPGIGGNGAKNLSCVRAFVLDNL